MGKIYGEMWFQSKTAQIYPREFSAFGISCTDRYGGKRQIVDMLNFCETCAFYIYDEVYGAYLCDMNMDEDDYVRILSDRYYQCPYYRNQDEYAVVRKQM